MKTPKVALIYDRVNTPHGGAEQVLLSLHDLYPTAPLFTAIYDPQKAPWAKVFPEITASFLNKIPLLNKLHRWIPFLMPMTFESFDLNNFDIVISITSAEAKGVLTLPHQLHICYLLTPPRYLYQDREHSLSSHWIFSIPGMNWFASLFLNYLTWWDQQAIFRPDVIIPISERVSQRVRKYYPGINPDKVIYPPVNINNHEALKKSKSFPKSSVESNLPSSFLLIVSRLVSYKHIDQAILACNNLNKNLVIVGDGPEKKKLKTLTKKLLQNNKNQKKISPEIIFYSNLPDKKLHTIYKKCDAFLMPGEEDFGIVALEANSYGKPVLINIKSGAAECIDHTIHGIHISQENVIEIEKAIISFEENTFEKTRLVHNSKKYDTNTFTENFKTTVSNLWQKK